MLVLATALGSSLAVLAACKVKRVKAPYDTPPAQAGLMDLAKPKLAAVQVPRAKVRQDSGPAATLEFAAQSPERFAGKIQVAGQELLSLAVNENEYGLRYVANQGIPTGFYAGPPSGCAVQTLLGVELEPRQLVSAMLGGAPLIEPPLAPVSQAWDSAAPGYEVVTVQNAVHEQELRFQYIDGRWAFAGTSVYRGSGANRDWEFTLTHEQFDAKGIPTKTVLKREGPKGAVEVTIKVLERIDNPPVILRYGKSGDGGEGGEEGDPFEEGGWEDPEAESEDVWDEEGWEEVPGEDDSEAAPAPTNEPSFVMTIQQTPSESTDAIPPVFKLTASGLPERGDLCRR